MELTLSFAVDKYIMLPCEMYESLEEVKYRLFGMFTIPADLFSHLCFYELIDRPDCFEETFVEDFVRVSDVLAT